MTHQDNNQSDAYFSIDVLLERPIDFNLEEIAEAVSTDYPLAAVSVHPVNKGKQLSTNKALLGMLKPEDKANGHVIVMNSIGHPDEEFRAADNSEIAMRSGTFSHCALTAIKTHKSYLTLSIQTNDTSCDGKLSAARQLMAVSAVFAQLPICLGVLVHWSSHMVDPKEWVKGVENAMRGIWPINEWISFRCGWDLKATAANTHSVGYSKGLRSFLGYELHTATAPVTPSDSRSFLKGACRTLLQDERHLQDGAAFSVGNQLRQYKISWPSSANGHPASVVLLVHPDAPEHGRVQKIAGVNRGLHRPAPRFMDALLSQRAASG